MATITKRQLSSFSFKITDETNNYLQEILKTNIFYTQADCLRMIAMYIILTEKYTKFARIILPDSRRIHRISFKMPTTLSNIIYNISDNILFFKSCADFFRCAIITFYSEQNYYRLQEQMKLMEIITDER